MSRYLLSILLLMLLQFGAMAQHASHHEALRGRTFVYGQDVNLPHPIRIDPLDARPLNQILDEALQGTGISYRITPSHILLFAPAAETAQPTVYHTLYGYVIDSESKETLIGANVSVPIHMSGTYTNEYGYFSISLPEGETLIETSYIGYQRDVLRLNLTNDTLVTIHLKVNAALDEVVIRSDKPETGFSSSRIGAATIPVQQIMNTPALLGEADVLKTLQLQPGVQPTMSGQSGMSVRGGDADQNLFLLDGMLLYNVDHVMGFESAFMPDAVKHVDFFKGSFPARYGGRLSSVTDVRTREGDMQSYHGTFSVGLLSSHLSVEGPVVNDRTSFIISARRTYADWLANAFKGMLDVSFDHLGLYFYDLNAKINHRLSDYDRLYLSFYSGRDVINLKGRSVSEYESHKSEDISSVDTHWGNTLYHLRWNHIFAPRLFANVTLGYNRFSLSSMSAYENRESYSHENLSRQYSDLAFKSGIDDLSADADFDYHPFSSHHLRFGAQYTLHCFRPEVQSSEMRYFEAGIADTHETFSSENKIILANEAAIYAEDDFDWGDHWQFNTGLRVALFSTEGKVYPAVEPRVSACRSFDSGLRVKAAYSLMHQYVHKISSSQIASPSDLWVPVTRDLRPMSAHQWSLGAGYNRIHGWEFGAEAFLKEMYNVIDIIDGASFFGNSKAWESKVTSGRGRSYGVELYASKSIGRTTGSVNYTLAKSDRWFSNGLINSGLLFPYRYDRRHVVHLQLQHQLTDHIDLNATWNYASGSLVTLAKQQTEYLEPSNTPLAGDYYSSRNNYRMKPSHQLDLSVNIHHPTRHGERIWNFSLINAYCHLNQDMVYATMKTEQQEVGTAPDGQPIVERKERCILKQLTVIPILPSFTYTYKF